MLQFGGRSAKVRPFCLGQWLAGPKVVPPTSPACCFGGKALPPPSASCAVMASTLSAGRLAGNRQGSWAGCF
eukprot:3189360-Alexandrium_andersonii.AAC.1